MVHNEAYDIGRSGAYCAQWAVMHGNISGVRHGVRIYICAAARFVGVATVPKAMLWHGNLEHGNA
jgi:hypothetical protein